MSDVPNLDGIKGVEAPKRKILKWLEEIDEMLEKSRLAKEAKDKKKVSNKQSENCKALNAAVRKFKQQNTSLGKQNPDYIPEGLLHENSAPMVERCIIAYIRIMPNAHAVKIGGKGTPRKNKSGETIMTNSGDTNGVSDIIAVIKGRMLCIEVKFSKGDKQSSAQVKFEKRIKNAWADYIIVKDFSDFKPKFAEWYTGEKQPEQLKMDL